MAKSKNGGTRAYIRGRIGSDVYSVGKDGKGQRQQVVRALAEVVSNPRSEGQMFGRMVMSTVMQAVSALQPIIDHSFDNVAKGQPSISEFIRRNYALIKADAIAHPAAGNFFGLNKYQEKGIKVGKYAVSVGSVALPTAVTANEGGISIELTANTLTVGGLKAALGLNAEGYLTSVHVGQSSGASFFRAQLTTTLADETAITAENVASLFTFSGTITPAVSLDSNTILMYAIYTDGDEAYGVIASDKIDGVWVHSTCVLEGDNSVSFASDVALPTYPQGAEKFLNGGDL